jgi:hypothetical protein
MLVLKGVGGAVAGAVALSIMTALASSVLESESFGRGQYAMGFAFTAPMGMLLGGITTLVVHQTLRDHAKRASVIATFGGAVVLAFATTIAWGSASSRDGGIVDFVDEVRSLWIAPSVLAGAVLIFWGARNLAGRR